jgi:hypothetical protein
VNTQATTTVKCSQWIDCQKLSISLLILVVMSAGLFTSTFATAQNVDPQAKAKSVSSTPEVPLSDESAASDTTNNLSTLTQVQEQPPTFSTTDAALALTSGALVGAVIGVGAAMSYQWISSDDTCDQNNGDPCDMGIDDAILSGVIGIGGAALGSSLGIYGYGKLNGFEGSYWATLGGTVAGAAVGGLPILLTDGDPVLLMGSVGVFSLAGGVWGYYASLPDQGETGQVTRQSSIGMPSFAYSKNAQNKGQYMLYLTGGQF